LLRTAAADHQRLATQFRVAQQIDRGVEGVHVEVRDAARPSFG
jgi:type II secretory pathway component PulL